MTATLDEAKAYLRIEDTAEDALIGRLIASATGICEQFTGQVLLARSMTETVPATGEWCGLRTTPVRAITNVQGLPATGMPCSLATDAFATDIDANGDGWVRVLRPASQRTGRARAAAQQAPVRQAPGRQACERQGFLRAPPAARAR